VRVQAAADGIRRGSDLGGWRAGPDQGCDRGVILRLQHALLREGQLIDRIVRNARPVDQFLDYVRIDAEGQHGRNDLDIELQLVRKALIFR